MPIAGDGARLEVDADDGLTARAKQDPYMPINRELLDSDELRAWAKRATAALGTFTEWQVRQVAGIFGWSVARAEHAEPAPPVSDHDD